jgi:tRNA (mo5U34)-methyltransferase
MLTAEVDVRAEVAQITWFHRIDLGNGVITPGVDDTPGKLQRFGLPGDLTGKTVLDVGAWDGFFSFEAERRGASRVLATDAFSWSGGGWGTKQGFDLAHRVLQSRVESQEVDVLDLSPETVGTFDLVLCLGVLYHMRHPLLALERVASVASDMLILETHVDMLDCPRPAMAFYPGAEVHCDPTNWCGPNPAMVAAMLRDVGFRRVRVHAGPYYLPRRTFRLWLRSLLGGRGRVPPCSARMVFHAWRS